jgi:hypothetical protein
MVIGGQAVLVYGEPRLTRDIDITLGVGVEELDNVQRAVKRLGLDVLAENAKEFVERTMVLPTVEEDSGIRVDFIFSFSSYERKAIERAKEKRLGEAMIRFATLEDVVIHKVIAGRARDIEDIRAILLKNPDYDARYIEKWLKEFDESLNGGYSALFRRTVAEIK